MSPVKSISIKDLFQKYRLKKLDLVKDGFFRVDDFEEGINFEETSTPLQKLVKLIRFIPFSLKNTDFIRIYLLPSVFRVVFKKLTVHGPTFSVDLIKQYNLRASIVSGFKPKNVLEIGTYLGWGAACFKFVLPGSTIFTMNPKIDTDSNNPIKMENVGSVYKRKKLDVKQIWADSTKYNYTKLPKINLAYIDGNHDYEFVKSDLINMAKLKVKYILVDDYIPRDANITNGIVYSPWNESVVNATNQFLKQNRRYKSAYWLVGTKLAILIAR